MVAKPKSARAAAAARKKAPVRKPKAPVEAVIPAATAPKVRSLQIGENAWYAATNEGLFISVDQGRKWYGQPVQGDNSFVAVNVYDDGSVTLISHKLAYLSRDWGKTWSTLTLPSYISILNNLTLMPDASLWLGASEGAVHSTDGGATWRYVTGGLPRSDVLAVRYDAGGQRLLATALHEQGVFESKDGGLTWQRTPNADVSIHSAIPLSRTLASHIGSQWLAAARGRRSFFEGNSQPCRGSCERYGRFRTREAISRDLRGVRTGAEGDRPSAFFLASGFEWATSVQFCSNWGNAIRFGNVRKPVVRGQLPQTAPVWFRFRTQPLKAATLFCKAAP